MKRLIREFVRAESGTSAYEYGLIAAVLSVGAIVALQALGTSLSGMFSAAATHVDNATPPITP